MLASHTLQVVLTYTDPLAHAHMDAFTPLSPANTAGLFHALTTRHTVTERGFSSSLPT